MGKKEKITTEYLELSLAGILRYFIKTALKKSWDIIAVDLLRDTVIFKRDTEPPILFPCGKLRTFKGKK